MRHILRPFFRRPFAFFLITAPESNMEDTNRAILVSLSCSCSNHARIFASIFLIISTLQSSRYNPHAIDSFWFARTVSFDTTKLVSFISITCIVFLVRYVIRIRMHPEETKMQPRHRHLNRIYRVVGNWWYKRKGGDSTRKKKSKI